MVTMHCPKCKHEISLMSKTCPHCGAAVSELGTLSTPPPPLPAQPRPAGLHELAYRQKMVLYAVLLNILTLLSNSFLSGLPESALTRVLPVLIVIASLCLIVFYIWAFYKLGVALGMSTVTICIVSILLVLPCISLIVLLVVINKATKRLQAAGVRVGLLGADLSTIPKEN
ncbi:MAG TPA: zinc ribbon domain-containing protein [Pirellulales bacterium]|jgi:hypothetical protein|nr:zinc ribbon domain-containing protein [Pirellulales bacterium]